MAPGAAWRPRVYSSYQTGKPEATPPASAMRQPQAGSQPLQKEAA